MSRSRGMALTLRHQWFFPRCLAMYGLKNVQRYPIVHRRPSFSVLCAEGFLPKRMNGNGEKPVEPRAVAHEHHHSVETYQDDIDKDAEKSGHEKAYGKGKRVIFLQG